MSVIPYIAQGVGQAAKWGPLLSQSIGSAYKAHQAMKSYKRITASKPVRKYKPSVSRSAGRGNSSLSYQNDQQGIYRRKRISRRTRRRYRRNYKRFIANDISTLARKTFYFETFTHPADGGNVKYYQVMCMTGCDSQGQLSSPNSDLEQIRRFIVQNAGSTGDKFYVTSCILDIQISLHWKDNSSITPSAVIIDVYDIYCRESAQESAKGLIDLSTSQDAITTGPGGVTGTTVQYALASSNGMWAFNPFDCSEFTSRYLISKVTRYQVSPTSAINITRKYRRNVMVNSADYALTGSSLMLVPSINRLTKGLLFVVRFAQVIAPGDCYINTTSSRRYDVRYKAQGDPRTTVVTTS